MKKTLAIASLLALAAVLGFSDISWAVDRLNTPECNTESEKFDPDSCHIQYIEPLQNELEKLWFQLVRLQGKKVEDNPWVFQNDNPVCDQEPQYYNEELCKLSTPGKLAQAKYLIREEINRVAYQAKIKQQKAQFAETKRQLDAAKKESSDKDKEITELNKEKASLVQKLAESNKIAEEQKKETNRFKFLFILFLIISMILLLVVLVSPRRT